MLVDAREIFLLKRTETNEPGALLDVYIHYYMKPDPLEVFNGLGHLKRFLNLLSPEKAMKVFAEKYNLTFNREDIITDYIYYLRIVAAMHCDCKEYYIGVMWAKKALDMFDYFYRKLNSATREKLKLERRDYQLALSLFEEYKDHFDEELYRETNNLSFVWEDEFYRKKSAANQSKIRKFD